MWVTHDLALLDLSVLLEQAGDGLFGETRVDASNEEIRAWIYGTRVVVIIGRAVVGADEWSVMIADK